MLDPELGHWLLQIKALRVDGEVLPFCEQGCKAVVDSGTSLLAVPTPIFPELYELLRWWNWLGGLDSQVSGLLGGRMFNARAPRECQVCPPRSEMCCSAALDV